MFSRLQEAPGTQDWTVLHSVEVPHQTAHVTGEIDFMVIIPRKGVLCLEIKPEITRRDGLWYYGRRSQGNDRGPFRQAQDGMYALLDYVKRDFGRIPFVSGVVSVFKTPNVPPNPAEWHAWQLIHAGDLDALPLSRLLERMIDHGRKHLAQARAGKGEEPSTRRCEQLANLIRQDITETPLARKHRVEREILRYTAEQCDALDAMEDNPRVIFNGLAGTGKTVLALEAAEQAQKDGCRVLLFCYNRLLGKQLSGKASSLAPNVVVAPVHDWMLSLCGLESEMDNNERDFWEKELPEKAYAVLSQGDGPAPADVLLVDEAQDIVDDRVFRVLDLSVAGGLKSGRCVFFGDFGRQGIYGDCADPLAFVREQTGGAIVRLRANCRNAPQVARLATRIGDIEHGYQRVRRSNDGIEPSIAYYGDAEEQLDRLSQTLARLYADGFAWNDIVVLSPHVACAAATLQERGHWGHLKPLKDGPEGAVGYSTIHAFKGLEAPAVVVTDVDRLDGSKNRALLYIAATRALHRLVMLADAKLKRELG